MVSTEKTIEFEGRKYRIDVSQKVSTVGDFDEKNSTVYVDKDMPAKFHEGIAVHEIHERNVLKKGHSYQYSHNEAQKRELEFYKKKHGDKEGEKMLLEEEAIVLAMPGRMPPTRKKKETDATPVPRIQLIMLKGAIYEGKTYIIDNSHSLIGDIVDFYEKKRVIYIDKDIPEWLFEGMAIYTIEERKLLKQGSSYADASEAASKKELAYYEEKLGSLEAAQKAVAEELKIQSLKFAQDKKDLKDGERKVVNEDVPK
ncbi:MAG: hypothetical protein PHO02_04940 [Candidatus Nanoarchaeia archaeon]|nr:hypothetical protein [Candidatus Nanoarchaeia archaeon]